MVNESQGFEHIKKHNLKSDDGGMADMIKLALKEQGSALPSTATARWIAASAMKFAKTLSTQLRVMDSPVIACNDRWFG